ncbi:hypothetical protein MUN77_05175 [Leucobacter allii]|uniref:hypothetical protein n=1 Tax=Leucobacter allii TaxID=2932247 RepID=UPI001FD03E0E|nr:hypothetical protein [Leucobacter allii]UOR02706.1 hypothetical protein MUN77_05175 [Leucobacter allii]
MHTQIRRTGAVLAGLALAATLASCAGGQSVADACAIATDADTKINESNSAITEGFSDLTSGESVNFGELLAPAQDALADAQQQITNEEVKGAYDKIVTSFSATADMLENVDLSVFQDLAELQNLDLSDPANLDRIEELQAKSDEIQEQTQGLQDDLKTTQDDLMSAVTELNEVCAAG